MAKLEVWADFNECRDVTAIYEVAAALKEAAGEARSAGCEVTLGIQDIGDQQLVISGDAGAVARAATGFAERGFDPLVSASSEKEFATLDELLPEEVGVELKG